MESLISCVLSCCMMAVTASESDTLEAVADRFKDYYEDDKILGIVNGRLRELNKKIKSDCELSFVTTADRDGRRTYRRSVVLLHDGSQLVVFPERNFLSTGLPFLISTGPYKSHTVTVVSSILSHAELSAHGTHLNIG